MKETKQSNELTQMQELPSADDVLRRMLTTPPKAHETKDGGKPANKKAKKTSS